MGILGTLVKAGIKVSSKLNPENKTPGEQQEAQLKKLLETAKDTAFGKYYGFSDLLKSDNVIAEFQQKVPIHHYDKMHSEWWAQQQKYADITWPGKPGFFALSSGTTGKESKRIPITDDFLHSIKDVGNTLLKRTPDFDFPKELFEGELFILSSTAHLNTSDDDHLEGEISGINVSNFPSWYDFFYRPGKEIASLNTWEERLKRIVEEAPNWNVSVIAGIPSWVMVVIKEIISHHNLSSIHDIWPNFLVYASGGVAFETYRKDFEAVCAKPITILDTYLASEGFFAFTARPGTMSMQLAFSHGYFYEFIPFDDRGIDKSGDILKNPVVHTISEVEPEKDYIMMVSSCAGAWRYIIGDTIKFINAEPGEIKITGRTKFFLNVVGSQLSEEKMDSSILNVSEKLKLKVNEYSVAAIRDPQEKYIHQWVIVTDDKMDDEGFAAELDETLKEANKNYRVARTQALHGISVISVSKDLYYAYLENNKKIGGQVKTPKVMTEEEMKRYLKFITGQPLIDA